jgi:hypothetical protein
MARNLNSQEDVFSQDVDDIFSTINVDDNDNDADDDVPPITSGQQKVDVEDFEDEETKNREEEEEEEEEFNEMEHDAQDFNKLLREPKKTYIAVPVGSTHLVSIFYIYTFFHFLTFFHLFIF